MDKPIRVLLLEENPADGELIDDELKRAGINSEVRQVESEHDLEQALLEFAPDVVVSDHSQEQCNALSALGKVRNHRPVAAVIVVSRQADEQVAVKCLRAGAEDIISKKRLELLPASINSALTVRARLRELTPRQMEIFRLIAEGFTTRRIAEILGISNKTVETHRIAVMKKLRVHDVTGLVRYAMRVGLAPVEN